MNTSPSIFMITINNGSDHTIFEYRSDLRSYAHYWTSSWIEFFELAWKDWFFSGLISTTDAVVFITARMASIFVSSTAVHKYDFYIFTVITKYFCHIRSLHLLVKAYCAVPIMSTLNWILSTIRYASYYLAVFCIFRLEILIRRLQFHRHVKNIM